MSDVRPEDFPSLTDLISLPWDEHFQQWCRTNEILVKYIYGELGLEDTEIVQKALEGSHYYQNALKSLEEHPNRSKYNSQVFAKTTEQTYKLIFRNTYKKLNGSSPSQNMEDFNPSL